MKWIIIHLKNGEKDASLVQSFLSLRQTESICYAYDPHMQPSTEEIHDLMKSSTHCVLLNGFDAEYEPVIRYIAGYAAGREIPFFITGTAASVDTPWFLDKNRCFDSISLFLEIIEDKLAVYSSEEGKSAAHRQLFDRGIPLTPDCFAAHIAAGHRTVAPLFLEAGIDVNSCNSEGVPMLCVAARNERSDMVSWLIENGADIDAISQDRGYSAVMDAAWKNSLPTVNILVNAGANLNFISRDGQTALILAVGTGNDAVCEVLVTHGADPLIQDHMGMSALAYAKLFKKEKLVSLFTAQKE